MKNIISILICLFVFQTKHSWAEPHAIIIVKLDIGQDIFFYQQSKFFYQVKDYSYQIEAKDVPTTDTILINTTLPNVLIFQENLAQMVPIVIFSGDTLTVRFDLNQKLQFGGTREREWNLMAPIFEEHSFTEPYLFNRSFKDIKTLDLEINNISEKIIRVLNDFHNRNLLTKEYAAYLITEENYHSISSWLFHKHKLLRHKPMIDIKMTFKKSALIDSLNFGSIYRHSVLYGFAQDECNCTADIFPTKDEFSIFYNFIKKNYTGLNRTILLFDIIYEQIKITQNYSLDKNYFNSFLDDFYAVSSDSDYVSYIRNITGTSNKINTVSLDSTIFLTDNGKLTDLKSIMKRNDSAKLIYLDLWASWCVPCRVEMPASKLLQSDYQKQGVQFIYISIDKNKFLWEGSVKKTGISKENSFLLPDTGNNYLKKRLSVTDIPRYVLLDKDGNVLDYNAPKPSDPKIKILLKSNLKQL